MTVTRLQDLPTFEVQRIAEHADPQIVGVFTHLKGVRLGRGWLYAGDADSLIGDVVDLDETSRGATFVAPFWSQSSPIQVGSRVPWLDGYWQAYHVTMILDTEARWQRVQFLPSAAQHFRQGSLRGWTKVGTELPEGAVPTRVDDTGWDHEHCELCQSKIGRGGRAYGYCNCDGRWLCEQCFQDFAAPRSLGFVFAP